MTAHAPTDTEEPNVTRLLRLLMLAYLPLAARHLLIHAGSAHAPAPDGEHASSLLA